MISAKPILWDKVICRNSAFPFQTFFFYAPNFEKVGDILVLACPYVCMYVRTYVCMYVFMFEISS